MSSPRAVRSQRAALARDRRRGAARRDRQHERRVHRRAAVRGRLRAARSRWWSPTIRRRSARRWSGCAPSMDVVIATGGLGPTEDDRTVDVVAELLGHRHVAGRAVARGDEEALLDARLRDDAEQPASGARPERRRGAAQHGRASRPGFVVALGGARRVLPARRAARDGEDVRRRGDAAAGAPAGRAGGPRPATRTWHLYGMGESHIDHRLAGILGGIEGATLHFRTSNPENHVKLVVRARRRGRGAGDAREGRRPSCASASAAGIYGVDGDTFPLGGRRRR